MEIWSTANYVLLLRSESLSKQKIHQSGGQRRWMTDVLALEATITEIVNLKSFSAILKTSDLSCFSQTWLASLVFVVRRTLAKQPHSDSRKRREWRPYSTIAKRDSITCGCLLRVRVESYQRHRRIYKIQDRYKIDTTHLRNAKSTWQVMIRKFDSRWFL